MNYFFEVLSTSFFKMTLKQFLMKWHFDQNVFDAKEQRGGLLVAMAVTWVTWRQRQRTFFTKQYLRRVQNLQNNFLTSRHVQLSGGENGGVWERAAVERLRDRARAYLSQIEAEAAQEHM